jgi:hypothetical protein
MQRQSSDCEEPPLHQLGQSGVPPRAHGDGAATAQASLRRDARGRTVACQLARQGDGFPSGSANTIARGYAHRRGEACLALFRHAPCRRRATHASPYGFNEIFVGARRASPCFDMRGCDLQGDACVAPTGWGTDAPLVSDISRGAGTACRRSGRKRVHNSAYRRTSIGTGTRCARFARPCGCRRKRTRLALPCGPGRAR